MKKNEYLDLRNGLIDEAENLINEGKIEEGQAKMAEISDLDNRFEAEAKELANLNVLKDNAKINEGVKEIMDLGKLNNEIENGDFYNTLNYRKAFMNYVVNGVKTPDLYNVDANTLTSDVQPVIPTIIQAKIIEKLESYGNILGAVTKTSYKGGLSIPVSNIKPVAVFVGEGEGSDKQKKTVTSITFGAYKLRVAVSTSLEVSVEALPFFETTLINNIAEALIRALEKAIVSGSGSGQPKGILKETPVVNIEITASGKPKIENLENALASIDDAYETEGLHWIMSKVTFYKYAGLKDSAGQPIGAVSNDYINKKPVRTLLGIPVLISSEVASYADTVLEDTVVGALFNMKDYVLNTNLQVTVKRYEDNDTDDQVLKAYTLVDGKVIDANSLVTITKKA